jgi:hypothetical protein
VEVKTEERAAGSPREKRFFSLFCCTQNRGWKREKRGKVSFCFWERNAENLNELKREKRNKVPAGFNREK